MKTSALVLIVALAGLDPLSTAAALAASQSGTADPTYRNGCSIPNVVGLSHDQAVQRLRSADYRVSIETRPSSTPRGTVIDQQPRRCADLSDGRTVVIVVSAGSAEGGTYDGEPEPPAKPTRPRSSGGSSVGTAAAVAAAAAIGIAIFASRNKDKKDEKQKSAPAPDPPATITPSAVVPAVTGMSSDEAQETIAAAKLQMLTTNEAEAAVAGSKVAMQVPAAGTPVVPGARVAVTFEAPPPPAPQPAPVPAPAPAPIMRPASPVPAVSPPPARVPRVPAAAPTVLPVIPSPLTHGLIEGPRRIVPMTPAEEVRPAVTWLLILLALLLITGLGVYRRTRRVGARSPLAPAHATTPPNPRFTVIPNLDLGEQRIVSGGASRTLDLSFTLDGGLQQILCVGSHVRIGAMS